MKVKERIECKMFIIVYLINNMNNKEMKIIQ